VFYLECKREAEVRLVGRFPTAGAARVWGERYAWPLYAFVVLPESARAGARLERPRVKGMAARGTGWR
jgi:hypothetical protein